MAAPRRRTVGNQADVSVQGAEDFLRVSKALKAAGQTGLRKELNKGLRNAAKPLLKVAKDAARTNLPQRGGAADFIANKKSRVKVATGSNPGVSVAILKQDPRLDSQGRLAHPVFNRRHKTGPRAGKRVYVVQKVRPGMFSRALEFSAPDVRDELVQVIDDMAKRIAREAG